MEQRRIVKKFPVVKKFPGYNREVLLVENGDDLEILKIMGETQYLPIEEAFRLQDLIIKYHHALSELGVPVADFISLHIVRNSGTGGAKLLEVSPYYGSSLEDRIKQASLEEINRFLPSVLREILFPLFNQSHSDELHIGIDIVPRNFCGNHNFVYVDFLPPKIEGVLEIPQPVDPWALKQGRFRHYSKKGILYVLFVQLCKLRPEMREDFLKIICSLASYFGAEEWLQKKIVTVFSPELVEEAIDKKDVYLIRDLANLLDKEGLITSEEKKEIFHLTHFQHLPLPETNYLRIKTFFLKRLRRI